MESTAKGIVISEKEFELFARLIHDTAGIYLAPIKKALLVGRLSKRLRALGLTSFEAYYDYLGRASEEEKREMLNCICTNETRFFREQRHFQFLEQVAIPRWKALAEARRRAKEVRVWSAACSTGQEPYSLAMTLLEHLPRSEGWSVDILATDLSTRALEKAEVGVYRIDGATSIPEEYLKSYMLRGVGSQIGQMAVGDPPREVVRFSRFNLKEEQYDVGGPFDLVVCSNVLIYFDPVGKADVVRKLLGRVKADGYLMVGHSESLTALDCPVRCIVPTVYSHGPWPGEPGRRGHRRRR